MIPPREFTRAVRNYLLAHELVRSGERVVVGVSGGPDSMALLHALHELATQLTLTLHVAHLDHQLRRGSARDGVFVAKAAARLGLWSMVGHVPVATLARMRKLSVEEAGRLARYRFLTQVARRMRARVVAVGHHADDQAETVLMRLLRGAGTTGLGGIRPTRPLAQGIQLVRPLLGVGRMEIESYVRWRHIPVRRDPTNRSRDFLRNRIRHDLLPLLARRYNPNIRATLARTATILAGDAIFLDAAADRAWQRMARRVGRRVVLSMLGLRRLPAAVRTRVLGRAAMAARADPRRLSQSHLDALLAVVRAGRGETHLPGCRAMGAPARLALTPVGSGRAGGRSSHSVIVE